MNLVWTEHAWDDYLYWQQIDKKIVRKINDLIRNIKKTPYAGIGKPEALKFSLAGLWSRRINEEHRLVYEISSSYAENKTNKKGTPLTILIYQCRYHY